MVDQESLNVVMVGTMADVRPRVAIYALTAGAHVLAAKPMAPSLAEAEEMLRTAKEMDRILMVGYNFRFRDDAQVVHRFIRDGGIGTPRFARAWSFAPSVPIRGSTLQSKVRGRFTRQNWGSRDGLGNLVPWQSTSHLRAWAGTVSRFADLPVLPSELETLRNDYDDPDLVSGYVHFADGVTLSVESMWMAPPQIGDNGVEVWGTQGYASLAPLRLLTWQDGDYVDMTEKFAPEVANSFHDHSDNGYAARSFTSSTALSVGRRRL